jgi:hypothetical protein
MKKSGWIYIAHCDGYYKIGVATNVSRRLKELQTGSPKPITLFGAVYHKDAYGYESVIHHLNYGRRVAGEWFELSDIEAREIFVDLVFLKVREGLSFQYDAGDDEAWVRIIENDKEHSMLCWSAIERYDLNKESLF